MDGYFERDARGDGEWSGGRGRGGGERGVLGWGGERGSGWDVRYGERAG